MREGSDEVDMSKVQHKYTYENITMNPIILTTNLAKEHLLEYKV